MLQRTELITRFSREYQEQLVNATMIGPDEVARIARQFIPLLKKQGPKSWADGLRRIVKFCETGEPQFSIFAKGNGKLPFWAFSALPGRFFCPGAGDCLDWCYSFGAWRYPFSMMRQIQNTLLLKFKPEVIAQAFQTLPDGIDYVRLYVDGDFSNVAQLKFWMDTVKTRPDITVYGYTKSLRELIQLDQTGYQWPDNYLFNLSGGHRHDSDTAEQVKALPIYRGEFIAIPLSRKVRTADMTKPEVKREIMQTAKDMGHGKVFPCPGFCDSCTLKDHACGSRRFQGVKIAIGIH